MSYWDQAREEAMPLPPLTELPEDRGASERALALVLLVNAMALGGVLGWIACRWLG